MGYVILSEDLRTMTIPATERIIGCVGDKNVRNVYFRMPRYCDDTDLSGYRIQVHYINASGVGNYYEVVDAVIGEEFIEFSWLVDRLACASVGRVEVNVVLTAYDSAVVNNRYISGIGKFKVKPGFINDPSGPIAIDEEGDFLVFLVKSEDESGD